MTRRFRNTLKLPRCSHFSSNTSDRVQRQPVPSWAQPAATTSSARTYLTASTSSRTSTDCYFKPMNPCLIGKTEMMLPSLATLLGLRCLRIAILSTRRGCGRHFGPWSARVSTLFARIYWTRTNNTFLVSSLSLWE